MSLQTKCACGFPWKHGFRTSGRVYTVLKGRRLWMMDWICYGMKCLCVILRCYSSFCLWWQENYETPTVIAGFLDRIQSWSVFNKKQQFKLLNCCFYWNKEEGSTLINKCTESLCIICRFFKFLKPNSESTFLFNSSNFQKNFAFWNTARLRPFLVLVREACRWRWAWRISGMILSEKNRSTRRKTWPGATASTTNLTRTDLGSKRGPWHWEACD